MTVTFAPASWGPEVWSDAAAGRLLALLAALPHGVLRMSDEIPNLVNVLLMAPDDLKSEGALRRKVLDAVGQIKVYRNRIAGGLPKVRRLSAANAEQITAHDARARISRYVASTAARLYRSATSRRPASAIRLR